MVFGLVLVGLLVFLTLTTVLYGLSVDARATGVGIALAIGAGVAALTGWHVLQAVSTGDDARPAGSPQRRH